MILAIFGILGLILMAYACYKISVGYLIGYIILSVIVLIFFPVGISLVPLGYIVHFAVKGKTIS